jgi:hypothetical protein
MKNRVKYPITFVIELINKDTGEIKLYKGLPSRYMAKGVSKNLLDKFGTQFTTNIITSSYKETNHHVFS